MVRTLPSLSHKCRVIHPIKLKIGDRKVPGYFSGESMGGRGTPDGRAIFVPSDGK